jgi:hypothetical protein
MHFHSQVGSSNQTTALRLLEQESLLHNRAGEAVDLMRLGGADELAGASALQWWHRFQRTLMARCDTCGETLLSEQQQKQRRHRGGVSERSNIVWAVSYPGVCLLRWYVTCTSYAAAACL